MAEYQADDKAAIACLQQAEDSLAQSHTISKNDQDEEVSRILRVRTVRAGRVGDAALADASLKQLETMASISRNRVIQSSYNGAFGARLMDQKKYSEAIAYLEEDQNNPLSLELLVQAYFQTNQTEKLHQAEAILRGTNIPTMEQAIVVPAARLRQPQS